MRVYAKPRFYALMTSLSVAIVIVVAGTVWAIGIAGRAERLAEDLRDTGTSAESAIVAADSEMIDQLITEMSDSRHSVTDFDGDLWPLKALGSVFGWVPLLGDNLTAVPEIMDRLKHDIDAAIELLDAADDLMASYRLVSSGDQGLVTLLRALPQEAELREVLLTLQAADISLSEAEKTASGMNDGRLWGRLGAKSAELDEREIKLRELIDWSRAVTESLLALARLQEISDPLVGLIDSGESLERTALEAMPGLEATAQDSYQAVRFAVQITPGSVAGSPIGQSLLDLEPLLGALAETARAGAMAWGVAEPALDLTEANPGGLIGANSNLLASMDILARGHSELATAREILIGARTQLIQTRFHTTGAANAASSFRGAVDEMTAAIGFMADFSPVGSEALGSEGPRTYLVLGQSSDELRATGGFVSGAWLVTFDSGQLTDIEYHDIVTVDDFFNLDVYPRPPDLLVQHMDAKVWLLRDVSWEPDFPTAAKKAAEIFQLGQGDHKIDGVVALTQYALVRLGERLGAVPTGGGLLEPENILQTLESGTDLDGREFMNVLFKGVIQGLESDSSSEHLFPILLAGADSLRRKDILVHMFEPELQEAISTAGWGGALTRTENDRIAIVDSNIGWSKVDRNIERSIKYIVDLEPDSVSVGHLTMSYFNNSASSFASCDTQEPVHGLSYQELKNACYWNLMRVYLAPGAGVIGNDPIPIPSGSVFARLGNGVPGGDSVEVDIGPGGQFVSGLLVVAPGATVSTSFDLTLPEGAITTDGDDASYRLEIPFQPGSVARDVSIQMNLPSGYQFISSSHVPERVIDGKVHLRLIAEGDVFITMTMRRGEPAVSAAESTADEIAN